LPSSLSCRSRLSSFFPLQQTWALALKSLTKIGFL
jgi:hypothetical protein